LKIISLPKTPHQADQLIYQHKPLHLNPAVQTTKGTRTHSFHSECIRNTCCILLRFPILLYGYVRNAYGCLCVHGMVIPVGCCERDQLWDVVFGWMVAFVWLRV